MQDQKDTMKKYLSMRRILIGAAILIVILAASSFVTAFAAVMIAKDMEENDGKLTSKETGETMGTQSTAKNYQINGAESTANGRRMEGVDNTGNPFRNAASARELFESCIDGNSNHIQVQCEDAGNYNTYFMCGQGSIGTPVEETDDIYKFSAGYSDEERRITVDCTGDEGIGPCTFQIPGCSLFDGDGAIPGDVIMLCDDQQNMQEAASTVASQNSGVNAVAVGRGVRYALFTHVSNSQQHRMQNSFHNCQFVPNTEMVVESVADWGKYRIDDRERNSGTTYDPSKDGSGVTVYVMDTGIQENHPEFGDRVRIGQNTINDLNDDPNGHGTHVAGIVGGATYGVAPRVNLVSVKVLNSDGIGHVSDVLAGLDFITDEVEAIEQDGTQSTRVVVTMALAGNGQNCELNNVVNKLAHHSGVVVVAAAGNGAGANGCDASPASASKALTVGAMNENDMLADLSSVGPCVDMYAPGTNIESAWKGSDKSSESGTSMAAAHVAGAAALMIQSLDFNTHPNADIKALMVNHASVDQITGTGTANYVVNNKLLYVGDYCTNDSDCTSTGDRNFCGCNAVCSTAASCPQKEEAELEEEGGTCSSTDVESVSCDCQEIRFPGTGIPKCTCVAEGCNIAGCSNPCSASQIDSSTSTDCVFQ